MSPAPRECKLHRRASGALFVEWVTPKENSIHARENGLYDNRGTKHSMVKLTENQVNEIKCRIEAGETHKELAKDFGVHKSCISKIATGNTWRHI